MLRGEGGKGECNVMKEVRGGGLGVRGRRKVGKMYGNTAEFYCGFVVLVLVLEGNIMHLTICGCGCGG